MIDQIFVPARIERPRAKTAAFPTISSASPAPAPKIILSPHAPILSCAARQGQPMLIMNINTLGAQGVRRYSVANAVEYYRSPQHQQDTVTSVHTSRVSSLKAAASSNDPSINIDSEDEDNGSAAVSVISCPQSRRMTLRVRLPDDEHITYADLIIEKKINQGSFGSVFKAKWKGGNVAVKKFVLGSGVTPERLKSIAKEINSYRGMQHPNIVGYFGTVSEFPELAVVTELVDGGNLYQLMYLDRVHYSAERRLILARQLARAVFYLHNRDPPLIHRDLKTENCLLDISGNLKLCDFGLARNQRSEGSGVLLKQNSGSPRYMSPEAFKEGQRITEKVDIWALACCVIEIFGGPMPLEQHLETTEVVAAVLTRREKPTVPSYFECQLKYLLTRSFEMDPVKRPTAQEFCALLELLTADTIRCHKMDRYHDEDKYKKGPPNAN